MNQMNILDRLTALLPSYDSYRSSEVSNLEKFYHMFTFNTRSSYMRSSFWCLWVRIHNVHSPGNESIRCGWGDSIEPLTASWPAVCSELHGESSALCLSQLCWAHAASSSSPFQCLSLSLDGHLSRLLDTCWGTSVTCLNVTLPRRLLPSLDFNVFLVITKTNQKASCFVFWTLMLIDANVAWTAPISVYKIQNKPPHKSIFVHFPLQLHYVFKERKSKASLSCAVN